MKKISIFTFCFSNYGAILQAFALQEYLKSLGNDVEIVNYCTSSHLKNLKVFGKRPKYRNPIKMIQYWANSLLFYRQYKQRIDNTQNFRHKYLQLTQRYTTVEEVKNNPPECNIYLSGSDQVFKPNSPSYELFYLGFEKGNGRKIAYAPSFGLSEFSDTITKRIERFVRDFDYLSCREKVGANYLSEICGKFVPDVVDPVFLHDMDFWTKIATKPSINGEYIFIYDLHGSGLSIQLARKIKDATSLPIVCLPSKRNREKRVDIQIRNAGPAEFVGLIQNAKFVVTDSFHATAFSIIFNKYFFAINGFPKTFSRIDNLLNALNLQGRIINKESLSHFDICQYAEDVNVDLIHYTQSSKSYIKTALNE